MTLYRRARADKAANDKRTDWEWMEKRQKERRVRMRRRRKRDRILVDEEQAKMARALGKEADGAKVVDPGDDSDPSSVSSDYDRKAVTRPTKNLRLDYGLPPDHPVVRGAAPTPGMHGVVTYVRRSKWAAFGVHRKKKAGGVIGQLRAYVGCIGWGEGGWRRVEGVCAVVAFR